MEIDLAFSHEKHPQRSVRLKVHMPKLDFIKDLEVKLKPDSIELTSPNYELSTPIGALVVINGAKGAERAPKTAFSKKTKYLTITMARDD